jgi:Asp-tRNA(Asn)/Glu-tRNA(Gln) amidotransferase C subunit
MSLTQAQIVHLAKLTSLHPADNLEISSVLDSFASLSITDTSHVTTISRSGQGSLILREDHVMDANIADELLACSSQKKAAHQIVLGGIMVGE